MTLADGRDAVAPHPLPLSVLAQPRLTKGGQPYP